jgi:hypothetical protein
MWTQAGSPGKPFTVHVVQRLIKQWVDSSDLETEMSTHDPVRYHNAWRALCSAKWVTFGYPEAC